MGVQNFYQIEIYLTTHTFHSRSSILVMLTSLLPLEGFHDFSKIKFLQQVLDKKLSPSSHMSLI
jgi:hypothetical protein